jgi:hypothetical protein
MNQFAYSCPPGHIKQISSVSIPLRTDSTNVFNFYLLEIVRGDVLGLNIRKVSHRAN